MKVEKVENCSNVVEHLSDQADTMKSTAAAYFSIGTRSTPLMAEQPASKPFHVIPTQRTKP
jgi:hypothetical protein